jgi:hypothetical protein
VSRKPREDIFKAESPNIVKAFKSGRRAGQSGTGVALATQKGTLSHGIDLGETWNYEK